MAARLASDTAESDVLRQRLQDRVSLSPWSDEEMLRRIAMKSDHEMPGIETFVTDDTGFAKTGKYSVGVTDARPEKRFCPAKESLWEGGTIRLAWQIALVTAVGEA